MYSLEILNHNKRPNALDYIHYIFPDFMELSGDRLFGDDQAILGGLASINTTPMTIIAQVRGRNLDEMLSCNFSMAKPEGFRKALRLIKQAEKFNRPVINFIDTHGAYPGIEAEERGQAQAIANIMAEAMFLKSPIVTIIIGHGGSGGALALCVANKIAILEHAVLSAISPKACAKILWKDASREEEAMRILKMTANDLYKQGNVDVILKEPYGGAHNNPMQMADVIREFIECTISSYQNVSPNQIVEERYQKYRKGVLFTKSYADGKI